jgi:hypothetical protein
MPIPIRPYSIIDPGIFVPKNQCFISPCGNIGVIVIRKNASTVLKEYCHNNNFIEGRIDQNKKRRYLAVLRDPIDRWYASINWYIRNHGLDKTKLDQSLVNFWFNNICWDDHTLPQYSYLSGIPMMSQITAVDSAPGLFDSINSFFTSFGYSKLGHGELPVSGHGMNGISQFDDDQLLLKVQKFYNQDYWLRYWLLDKDVPNFIKDEGVDLG